VLDERTCEFRAHRRPQRLRQVDADHLSAGVRRSLVIVTCFALPILTSCRVEASRRDKSADSSSSHS
jgi:hypothetical protein